MVGKACQWKSAWKPTPSNFQTFKQHIIWCNILILLSMLIINLIHLYRDFLVDVPGHSLSAISDHCISCCFAYLVVYEHKCRLIWYISSCGKKMYIYLQVTAVQPSLYIQHGLVYTTALGVLYESYVMCNSARKSHKSDFFTETLFRIMSIKYEQLAC